MASTITPTRAALDALREKIGRIAAPAGPRGILPFGVAALDAALPGGGLPLGAVHEFCEGGEEAWRASTTMLFAAGLLARLNGPVLWCLHSRDLFAPALARVGLHPDRVIYCETWKDAEVLPAMEEGLRYRGLAGVVGELARLPLGASRRLQLAAEASGVAALVLRRTGAERDESNAAFSRWRIAPAAAPEATNDELGRPHWRVELLRCRGGGEERSFILEACDAKGCLAVPASVGDRSHKARKPLRAVA